MKIPNPEDIVFVDARGDLKKMTKFLFEKGVRNMVEIGSLAGVSTAVFAEFVDVLSIDPYTPGYDPPDANSREHRLVEAQKRFTKRFENVPNVRQWNLTSVEAAKKIPDESLDFVYIDACHTYESVKQDIAIWRPKIKPEGFIGGHDYHPGWKGVKRAVEEVNPNPVVFNGTHWLAPISTLSRVT